MGIMDYVALLWFLSLWIGYTYFSKKRSRTTLCLASQLRTKRNQWMLQMLLRENRIADVSIIAALERNIAFFASSSLLILAGLLTAVLSADKLSIMFQHLLPHLNLSPTLIQMKACLMIYIYVFAFFQFTWSLRQYGFAGVLVGAAPNGQMIPQDQLQTYANRTAKVIDQAGHSFNYGLRAIYFSIATLAWFIHSGLFMASTILVVAVLYHREYHSKVLKALSECD